jgi:hypothetical protein
MGHHCHHWIIFVIFTVGANSAIGRHWHNWLSLAILIVILPFLILCK